jgi:hemerythrin superfamily protein
MARSKRSSSKPKATKRGRAQPARTDAVSLLKADHRRVEGWFKEYAGAGSPRKKRTLAAQICAALRVHTSIEEEIFYPAFLKATMDKDVHHEAVVEHDSAKKLIVQIEQSDPSDDYFDSKVKVLSEMIRHHVKEEEQADGMFAEARAAKMDLEELGAELLSRKQELSGATAG